MNQEINKIENTISKSTFWQDLKTFLNQHMDLGKDISISVKDVLIIITVIFLTTIVLRILLRIVTKRVPEDDSAKLNVVFGYFRWLVYIIISLITLDSVGVNVTEVFAASAALLIGIGLALQTLFQDIISGVFILIDQSRNNFV